MIKLDKTKLRFNIKSPGVDASWYYITDKDYAEELIARIALVLNANNEKFKYEVWDWNNVCWRAENKATDTIAAYRWRAKDLCLFWRCNRHYGPKTEQHAIAAAEEVPDVWQIDVHAFSEIIRGLHE